MPNSSPISEPELAAKAEVLLTRLRRNRIDQYRDIYHAWVGESVRDLRAKGITPAMRIGTLLAAGCRVTAGYYTTDIRGYHEYMLFHQPPKPRPAKQLAEPPTPSTSNPCYGTTSL